MNRDRLRRRFWVIAAVLIAGVVMLHGMSHGERIPLREPLDDFPMSLGVWRGEDAPFTEGIVRAVGVTDYVNRIYTDGKGDSLGFYVGYYASQRTGDTIHSPKHCLPGGGWAPLKSSRLRLKLGEGKYGTVNDYIIAKGLDRQEVLYWYQSEGRVVASEYWARLWLIVDAITHDRTDGALVRVMVPITDSEAQARTLAVGFVRDAFPHLKNYLPG